MNKRIIGVAACAGGLGLFSFTSLGHSASGAQTSPVSHAQLAAIYQSVIAQTTNIRQFASVVSASSATAASIGSGTSSQMPSVSATMSSSIATAENGCQATAAEYNKAAGISHSTLGDLPASIDPANPATSCSAT
jgi:uncharacterized protein YukE